MADKEYLERNYPEGTDLLWMIHFMPEDENDNIIDWGSMDGHTIKLSGTLEEIIPEAIRRAKEMNSVIQCIRRRY
jgi:hypothetical protein